MKKTSALIAALLLVAGGVFACNSTTGVAGGKAANGECPAVGDKVCTSDDAATQSDVDDCTQRMTDPTCGAAYTTYYTCLGKNVDCTGGHNAEDVQKQCGTELSAYAACKGISSDGGTLADDSGVAPDSGSP